MDLAGKTVLVIGLARTGLAVTRFLLKKGSRLVVVDDKTSEELAEQIGRLHLIAGESFSRVKLLVGGTFTESRQRVDLAIVSPGVPLTHPAVQAVALNGVSVISEIELACRFLKGHIVGITGSNGKTTCTAMIGAILAKKYPNTFISGNIGKPLIEQVDLDDESSWHSVELSSFQLESVDQFCPDVAVVLNLTLDHMDRYESMDRYREAKERIFKNQGRGNVAVLNADDALVAGMARRVRAEILWFSRRQPVKRGVFVKEGKIFATIDGVERDLLSTGEIPLRGGHNVENVLACSATALAAGVSREQIAEAVRDFEPVEHRLEYVDTVGGVAFFNDSKATNVDAAAKALEAFSEPLVVIMGGRDKGSDFSVLRAVVKNRARRLVLLGEATAKIERALGDEVLTYRVAGMQEAIQVAFSQAQPGDVVLLAPACASFDMFHDYEERGLAFKVEVQKLKAREGERSADRAD
ncbi:MAG: UDP-N-acetylmuramoyl-L-alanine--D-glutamate ligase [Acidobacteria bacterium]|nr:UDP-N-acetylmuramoyl-L-alanine--D-glutamate ligase [Acidobacteriota bacterium]